MAYFRNLCLVEAPQAVVTPFPRYISDCIGVAYLGAAVEDVAESLVMPEHCYDERVFDSLERLLRRHPCDLVAISSMTGAWNQALRLARIARDAGSFVVVGGFHPTALPEEVLREPAIDLVVIGEGEETFRELVLSGPSRTLKGIAYREGGAIVRTEPRPLIADIDTIRFPLRNLRPERYGEHGGEYSIDTIYTSRGCPWSCSFCANSQMHGKWRARSAENVVREIELLHDPRTKKLLKIWDANFLTSIRRAERICDLMIERGLTNFRIMTETRAADLVRAEKIMEKLKAVGLQKVGIGIESPNPETLRLLNKKNALEEIERAVAICRRHGIGTEGYFILGTPDETAESCRSYPDYARRLGLSQVLFMVMTPYPGTEVYRTYEREGMIRSRDWDLYNNFSPVVSAGGMGPGELVELMAYCTLSFSRFGSLMKRGGKRGALVALMAELLQISLLLRVNRSLTPEAIEEALSRALLGFAGAEGGMLTREHRSAQALRPVRLRVGLSGGRALEFLLEAEDGTRRLTMTPVAGAAGLRLADLARFAASVPMDSLMAVLYQGEWLRNNPRQPLGSASRFLPFLTDPALLRSAFRLVRLGLRGLR
ncbi:radical SAM protein [Chlorobium sp. N1]|uniref:B12-binding domain-containing radical SAM protein n=1 Tax=Chlorobium sp. N1 TaxID=2491138 RepID=UPI00103B71E7|nr:radical SAM protein [Chlorobium sp. N1]TCD48793.1 radical SAM protein [Chlorobium sp. N1]